LIARAQATAKVAIDIAPNPDGGWSLSIGPGPNEPSDVLWVRYLPESNNAVKAGENRGRELRNFNIVRAVTPLGEWRGASDTFAAPADDAAGHRRIALLQSRRGHILGAAALPDAPRQTAAR